MNIDLLQEGNIENTFPEGLVKILLNDKSSSNNNKMAYSYYKKLLKEHVRDILSSIYNTPVGYLRSV